MSKGVAERRTPEVIAKFRSPKESLFFLLLPSLLLAYSLEYGLVGTARARMLVLARTAKNIDFL